MINVQQFVSTLTTAGIDFFCGVPDSLLKSFCAYVTDLSSSASSSSRKDDSTLQLQLTTSTKITHVIAANEGGAIANACGYNQPGHPTFKQILVAKGARADLGRPKEPPQVNKSLFMHTLGVSAQ